jgi:hypothetical protein
VVPANRVNASSWEGGECGGQNSFENRQSVWEEILTGVAVRHRRTSTSAKWEKGKEKQRSLSAVICKKEHVEKLQKVEMMHNPPVMGL